MENKLKNLSNDCSPYQGESIDYETTARKLESLSLYTKSACHREKAVCDSPFFILSLKGKIPMTEKYNDTVTYHRRNYYINFFIYYIKKGVLRKNIALHCKIMKIKKLPEPTSLIDQVHILF